MISIEEKQASVQSHRQAAEEILGPIKWINEHEQKGYCPCPGEDEHSGTTANSDCIVYLDGAPTIFCFHASCIEARKGANKKLRSALAGGTGGTLKKGELSARQREDQARALTELRAASSLRLILRRYQWTSDQIQADSPVLLQGIRPESQWKNLITLFKPEDVIWIGNIYDSGKAQHQNNFRPVFEWLEEPDVVGQLTCPSTFKNNSFSRCNDSVLERRFLVVESDILNRDQVGAVFQWINREVGLPLRAVVDTAGKSLHGWFDFPKKSVFEELQIVLPQLGCDPGLFRPSQPCRIPSALRDGKYQRLIYLNGKEAR